MIGKVIFRTLAKLESSIRILFSQRVKVNAAVHKKDQVTIIIVVYNGLTYLKKCINSLKITDYKNFEIVVVNNNSNTATSNYLHVIYKHKIIDKLVDLKENKYFSGGNNIGAKLADKKSKYLLLLNSDTEIVDPSWLTVLVNLIPQGGVISYGYASIPFRPDGWCFLIDRVLYLRLNGIDEKYKMNWGITDLTKRVLDHGRRVSVVVNSQNYILHHGSRSYDSKTNTKRSGHSYSLVKMLLGANWLRIKSLILE